MTIINGIEIDDIKYVENETKRAIKYNDPIEDNLHVVIVLSNPCGFATRYILAREFIKRLQYERNIVIYIVELAYGNQDYYITQKNNSKHLQLRTNENIIWHKENLINIGIRTLLPKNWKAVAWLDTDIEFDSPSWALDTLKILNGYKDIVQLFSHTIFMDQNGDTETIFTGLGFQHIKGTKRSTTISKVFSFWHPGFAWACNRNMYERMGGLYEYAITGDGDMIMATCIINTYKVLFAEKISNDYRQTLETFEEKVKGSRLGYVPGVIHHHFHGSINSRKYDMRETIIIEYNYSPTIYLDRDSYGLLVPSAIFPKGLKDSITNHFKSKNEDSHRKKVESMWPQYATNNTTNNTCLLYTSPSPRD